MNISDPAYWKSDRLKEELKMRNEEIGKLRLENTALRKLIKLWMPTQHLLPGEEYEDRMEYLIETAKKQVSSG